MSPATAITPEIMRDTDWQVDHAHVPSWLREDARQEGFVRILKARARFDPSKGSFRHFCRQQSRGAASDFMRQQDWVSRGQRRRIEAGEEVESQPVRLDLAERTVADAAPTPERLAARSEVTRLLAFLPARLRFILIHRYWFDRGQAEIAADLGLHVSRISELERMALARLRAYATRRRP